MALLALLLPLLGQAQERGRIPSWYGEIKGGSVFADPDLGADDGRLVAFSLGKNFSAKWAVELEAIKDTTDYDAGFEMDREALQLNVIQVNRDPLWNPYFLLGFGAQHFDLLGEDDTGFMVSVAVGGMWNLNNAGLMLRADARYRYSTLESDLPGALEKGEPVFTLGLVLPLGR